MKIVILFSFLSISIFAQQQPLKTVDYVDIKKYIGLWYEIAKIPNRFQSQCVKGTTAQYSLKDDGEIEVFNSCINEDGETDKTEGIARIVDKQTNAKLEVSFFSIIGWRPIWGDYWIIGLDENYQWAIVGTPSRKYGWILSRTPKLEQSTLDKIFSILKERGYNPKEFEFSKQ
ncbi:lipocalin family protein [Ignavibacterium sp.]|uniref:lipocalin family protein n=1 Tax=Ignavibacterium sp. TaxID=2651167 RepID=UPI00307CF998